VIRGSSNLLNGTASATTTSDTQVIAAQGVDVKIHVTDIIIANSSATNTQVDIKDGGTIKLTYPAPSTGGAVHRLGTPLAISLNSPLNFASHDAATTIAVSALGYKGE
jgi:hypothetical protein